MTTPGPSLEFVARPPDRVHRRGDSVGRVATSGSGQDPTGDAARGGHTRPCRGRILVQHRRSRAPGALRCATPVPLGLADVRPDRRRDPPARIWGGPLPPGTHQSEGRLGDKGPTRVVRRETLAIADRPLPSGKSAISSRRVPPVIRIKREAAIGPSVRKGSRSMPVAIRTCCSSRVIPSSLLAGCLGGGQSGGPERAPRRLRPPARPDRRGDPRSRERDGAGRGGPRAGGEVEVSLGTRPRHEQGFAQGR